MGRVLINEDTLIALGQAIRTKTDNEIKLTPSQLVTEVNNNLYGMRLINESDYINLGNKKDMLYLIPAESVGSTSDKVYRAVPDSIDVTVTCDDIDSGVFINQYFDKSIDTLTVTAGYYSVFNSPQDITNGKYLDVKRIILDNTITDIGIGAFNNLDRLEEVELHIQYANTKQYTYTQTVYYNGANHTSTDVIDIYTFNAYTFSNCSNLYRIKICDDCNINGLAPYALSGCSSLVEFVCEDRQSYDYLIVLDHAFSNCSNLVYVKGKLNFYNSQWYKHTPIAKEVFSGCYKLKYMSGLNETYSGIRYCEKIPFEDGFENCHSLTDVTLNCDYIAKHLFKGAKNIQYVTITRFMNIATEAFLNNTSLIGVTIEGNSNTDAMIAYRAFEGCTNLGSVDLSNSKLSIIEGLAFKNCTNLKNLNLSLSTLTQINADTDGSPFINSGVEKINLTDANITSTFYTFYGTSHLTEVKLPTVLTTIGAYTFKNSSLTTLKIPDNVTTLGDDAFNSSNISTIDWGNAVITSMGNRVFANSGLLSFTVPDMITNLGNSCFSNSRIQTITIHDSITKINSSCFAYSDIATINLTANNTIDDIEANAFFQCTNLTSLDFTEFKVSNIRASAFSKSGITSLDFSDITKALKLWGQTFQNCTSLTTIDLSAPYSLTLSSSEFSNCTALTTITFPSVATYLDMSSATNLFENCTALQSVNLAAPITALPASVFKGCSTLATVILPDTITTIGNSAFENCVLLDDITTPTNTTTLGLPTNLTAIGSRAFANTKLTGVVDIDSTITTNISAFAGCKYLTKIVIRKPKTVVLSTGDNSAFVGCEALTEVRLYVPSGYSDFTRITQSCFSGCTNLTTVYIPATVTAINANAFLNCISLTDVYFEGTEAQWNSITISSSGNSALTAATKHFESV